MDIVIYYPEKNIILGKLYIKCDVSNSLLLKFVKLLMGAINQLHAVFILLDTIEHAISRETKVLMIIMYKISRVSEFTSPR